VGRPLGAAIGNDTLEIPPNGSWVFTTSSVMGDPGVSEVAFPVAALAR
jgi:hypothetical protein